MGFFQVETDKAISVRQLNYKLTANLVKDFPSKHLSIVVHLPSPHVERAEREK